MEKDNRDVAGFCVYCKAEIYDGDDYVVVKDNSYHISCYKLIKEELEGDDSEL